MRLLLQYGSNFTGITNELYGSQGKLNLGIENVHYLDYKATVAFKPKNNGN